MAVLSLLTGGCASVPEGGRAWVSHNIPTEAEWIRNGQPLEFEGEQWYPMDDIENLLDSEVYDIGEYKGAKIFVEQADVRPFNRLYIRFAKNKYRLFGKR